LTSLIFLALGTSLSPVRSWADDDGPPQAEDRPEKKYRDFAEVTKGAKKHEGLFQLYQVDEHLYGEIRPNQFNEMFLAPIAIARGMASAGTPLNFGDEWVLTFRRVGDQVPHCRRRSRKTIPIPC
jgi:hypothetical protein